LGNQKKVSKYKKQKSFLLKKLVHNLSICSNSKKENDARLDGVKKKNYKIFLSRVFFICIFFSFALFPIFSCAQSTSSSTLDLIIPTDMLKGFTKSQLETFKKLPKEQQKKLVAIFNQLKQSANNFFNNKQNTQKTDPAQVCYPSSSNYNQQACNQLSPYIQPQLQQFGSGANSTGGLPMSGGPQGSPVADNLTGNNGGQSQSSNPGGNTGNPGNNGNGDMNLDLANNTPNGDCPTSNGIQKAGSSACPLSIGPNKEMAAALLEACQKVKKPIMAQSIHRPANCNNGAPRSNHLAGNAIDMYFTNLSETERVIVLQVFRKHGMYGSGCYGNKNYAHISFSKSEVYGSGCPEALFVSGFRNAGKR
jgi:hypothetical protein